MSEQDYLFEPIPLHKLDTLSKDDFKVLVQGLQDTVLQLRKFNDELKQRERDRAIREVLLEQQYIVLRSQFFGRSSERRPSKDLLDAHAQEQQRREPKQRVQLPSLRYPHIPLIEKHVELKEVPSCSCCGKGLVDTGMTEDSEQLSVIPKKFIVIRLKKHKYGCASCHEEIVTVPTPPRIKPGSSYGDELIIDVAVAKCDYLLPIERYVRMAKDLGVTGLPPQSLIETTHYLAEKLIPIYEGIKKEVLAAEVLHADETPHRMLEGDKRKTWYLWGFSSGKSSYFELHGTRSGEVASTILTEACAKYLVSDVYSGYKKAVTDANREREIKQLPAIQNLYCNAHARRKFTEAKEVFPEESEYFLTQYEGIYKTGVTRDEMRVVFTGMQSRAHELLYEVPEKSVLGRALSYFVRNFDGLTRCLDEEGLPLDNNSQERQMRNPVVGRKTWYGTHSKQGAKTAAILFTVIESCKLNRLNSNEYLEAQIDNLNYGRPFQTPAEYQPKTEPIQ